MGIMVTLSGVIFSAVAVHVGKTKRKEDAEVEMDDELQGSHLNVDA